MQGNTVVALIIGIILALVAIGWAWYGFLTRRITIGVLTSTAIAQARNRSQDLEGGYGNGNIPKYSHTAWIRPQRPKKSLYLARPGYILVRTVNGGVDGNWVRHDSRTPQSHGNGFQAPKQNQKQNQKQSQKKNQEQNQKQTQNQNPGKKKQKGKKNKQNKGNNNNDQNQGGWKNANNNQDDQNNGDNSNFDEKWESAHNNNDDNDKWENPSNANNDKDNKHIGFFDDQNPLPSPKNSWGHQSNQNQGRSDRQSANNTSRGIPQSSQKQDEGGSKSCANAMDEQLALKDNNDWKEINEAAW